MSDASSCFVLINVFMDPEARSKLNDRVTLPLLTHHNIEKSSPQASSRENFHPKCMTHTHSKQTRQRSHAKIHAIVRQQIVSSLRSTPSSTNFNPDPTRTFNNPPGLPIYNSGLSVSTKDGVNEAPH